jgi:hypothetical protein
MATQKQIDANRQNALKSTGPKTPEGKQAVRLNALIHGLRARTVVLPNENGEAFEQLCADLEAEWQPQTRTEEIFLEDMAIAHWRLMRAEACEKIMMLQDRIDKDHMAFITQFSQMQARLKRAFLQAMHELERLQQKRKSEPLPDPELEPQSEPAPKPKTHFDHPTSDHAYTASAASTAAAAASTSS